MTDQRAMPRPRATLVMTARERHSLADAAIDGVLRATPRPYRFVYLDVQSPPALRRRLAARAAAGEIELVRYDEPLWPQEARARFAGQLDTDYVVFLDNDILVAPGWLDALVRCADETGAGIVGPLYLWGDGVRPPSVHMAGGKLVETPNGTARSLEETHVRSGDDPNAAGASLARSPCDFVEFHCMLVRTALVHDFAVLDPALRCVHEHIDVSLSAKRRGFATMLEPAARITYLAFADYRLSDLDFFRARWSATAAEADIATFCRKWQVVDDARSFAGVRSFVAEHVGQVDPLRAGAREQGSAVMPAAALRQTRSGLLDAAAASGYRADELAVLASAYHVAHVLVDGGYRPCGRPFIDHLVGTASVLVHYGLRVDIVAAGLLHAAYTHSPSNDAGARAALKFVRDALGGRGHPVEQRVRAYTLAGMRNHARRTTHPTDAGSLSIRDAEIALLDAANELDLNLSGELRYSGRADELDSDALARIGDICALVGVPGLHASLVDARANRGRPVDALVTRMSASYRIGSDRTSATKMAVNDLSALADPAF